jgi:hypothetical protein
VLKQLRDEHKWARGNMHAILQQYQEGEAFLHLIVTGDERWVHHYEPASKCQKH